MYARVMTIQVLPDKVAELIKLWRQILLPTAQQQQGFRGAQLLVDRPTGKAMIIGQWETEADLEASGPGSPFSQEQLARLASLLVARPMADTYEVGGEAKPEE